MAGAASHQVAAAGLEADVAGVLLEARADDRRRGVHRGVRCAWVTLSDWCVFVALG